MKASVVVFWRSKPLRWVASKFSGALGLWLALSSAQAIGQTACADRGEQLFESRCGACHSLDANRTGPALRTVMGRKAGTASDFFYSKALAGANHVWSPGLLRQWLTDPETVVSGQEMGYRVEAAADRDELVAYLACLAIQR
jgi:cytochrome c